MLLWAAAAIPRWVSGGGDGDHVRGRRRVGLHVKRTVGPGGLQQLLLLGAHRDLQAPPDGERGEMQQKQLGTASQVSVEQRHGEIRLQRFHQG